MNSKPETDGLQRLLDFVAFLRDERIVFSLHNRAPDTVSVDFAGVGIRYEVDFFVDEMRFSYFKGSEESHSGDERLRALIHEHWGD